MGQCLPKLTDQYPNLCKYMHTLM